MRSRQAYLRDGSDEIQQIGVTVNNLIDVLGQVPMLAHKLQQIACFVAAQQSIDTGQRQHLPDSYTYMDARFSSQLQRKDADGWRTYA